MFFYDTSWIVGFVSPFMFYNNLILLGFMTNAQHIIEKEFRLYNNFLMGYRLINYKLYNNFLMGYKLIH
jgi:hypothetical protein